MASLRVDSVLELGEKHVPTSPGESTTNISHVDGEKREK